jgi:hypothetical protein
LAALDSWRWVEQENSKKLQAESQKLKRIRCTLKIRCKPHATRCTLLNTGINGMLKEKLLLLLMLKIKYYNNKQLVSVSAYSEKLAAFAFGFRLQREACGVQLLPSLAA